MAQETRYYYKEKEGNSYLSLKYELSGDELEKYDEITEEEWNEGTARPKPTAAQLHKRELKRQINQKKSELAKTDYVVIKIAEAETEEQRSALREEYATVISHRIELRAEINELEGELE